MTPTASNQCTPDRVPLVIPLPQRLIPVALPIEHSGPYMDREQLLMKIEWLITDVIARAKGIFWGYVWRFLAKLCRFCGWGPFCSMKPPSRELKTLLRII